VDEDGIPLSTYSHWQNALLRGLVCRNGPRITGIEFQLIISG
jgi:hypothetical protein